MKLVLDKFLWIGLGVLLFGFYELVNEKIVSGVSWISAGAFVLLLMIILIVRHYEIKP